VETTVFGLDKTAMHWAYLYNYLGIPEISCSDFQKVARDQVAGFGVDIVAETVTELLPGEDIFTVTTDSGKKYTADYVVIAEGKAAKLAQDLGLEKSDSGIIVDREGRTAIANLYVVGRATRVTRSQAIISAGEGAATALDILSAVHGKEFNDFDTPPEED
jgi:thioredoxin reductase